MIILAPEKRSVIMQMTVMLDCPLLNTGCPFLNNPPYLSKFGTYSTVLCLQ